MNDEEADVFKILGTTSVELTVNESDDDSVCTAPLPTDNNSGTYNNNNQTALCMIDATNNTNTNHSQTSISSSVVEMSRIPPLLIPNRQMDVQPGAYHHGGIDLETDIDSVYGNEDLLIDERHRRNRSLDGLDMSSLLTLSNIFFSDETIVSAVLVEDDNEAPSNGNTNRSVLEPLEATMLVQAIVLDESKRCFRQLTYILQSCVLIAILLMGVFFLVTLKFGVPVLTFQSKNTIIMQTPTEPPNTSIELIDESFNDTVTVEEITSEPSGQLDDLVEMEEIVEELDDLVEIEEIVAEEIVEESVAEEISGVPSNFPSSEETVLETIGEDKTQDAHEKIETPMRYYSYHMLNWGSGTYCDSFHKGNVTISCGGNGVIDQWEGLSGHCESVGANALHCMHERYKYEGNSTVIFSCLGSSDLDLYATAYHDSSSMSECRVLARNLFIPKVTGVSTNYLNLGRFCQGVDTGTLSLKDNHECHGGQVKSIYMAKEGVKDLSELMNLETHYEDYLAIDLGVSDESWQTFCYSKESCQQSFRACEANLTMFSVDDRKEPFSLCAFDEDSRPEFDKLQMIVIEQKYMSTTFLYDFWYSSYDRN